MSSRIALNNRAVFVTGGSLGIGLAIARELASRGANVFIVALERDDPLAVSDELSREFPSGRFGAAACDVSDYAAVERAVDQMLAELGSVDGVVCNAGLDVPGYFAEKPPEEFRRLMEVNYLGSVHAAKCVLPHLAPGSFIAFTSSMAGVTGVFGYSSYCPTKFAQIGLAETLLQELAPRGIQVSVLCPPDTDTPGLRDPSKKPPQETEAITKNTKLMKPEDVARKFVDQLVAGKFHIKVNLESHFIYRFKGLTPNLYRWALNRAINKGPRKNNDAQALAAKGDATS